MRQFTPGNSCPCWIGHIYLAAQEKDLPLNMLCGSRTYHGARVFVENQIKVLQQSNLRHTLDQEYIECSLVRELVDMEVYKVADIMADMVADIEVN